MFDNAVISLMIMLFLSFIGLMVMFFFILRSLGTLSKYVQDFEYNQNRALQRLDLRLSSLENLVINSTGFKEDSSSPGVTSESSPKRLDLPSNTPDLMSELAWKTKESRSDKIASNDLLPNLEAASPYSITSNKK